MLPNEIFLSHSEHDRQFVDHVADIMRQHGLPVWYSRTQIRGGHQWHDEIGLALRRCDWFVIVLSPSSVKSMWAKRELLYSLEQIRFENKIVPVLFQPCNYELLSWTLSSFHMIDFTQTFEKGCRDLLQVWNVGFTHL